MRSNAIRAVAATGVLVTACCACSSSPARPAAFDPMQLDPNDLPVALGPVTGTGTGSLTVTASRSMSLTIACIGRGQVTVTGPLSGAMLCSVSRGAGTFSGWYWAHLKVRPGERIRLRVAADAHTRWDIRVDG